MERENIIPVIVGTMILIVVLLIIVDGFLIPPAADQAQETCMDRGFDNYDTFSRVPFTTTPLGVTCKYESRYLLDKDGNVLVDGR